MRKFITAFAIIVLLSVAPNAFAQAGFLEERDDFPATTLFGGVSLEASLNRIWRFEPFVKLGQHAQFARGEWYRRITWPNNVLSLTHYNPSLFTRSTSLRFGTDFRLTPSDYIRLLCQFRLPIAGGQIRADEFVFLVGYVRKQSLTERMRLDISLSYGIQGSRRLMNEQNLALASYDFTSIEAGIRLNHTIIPNLNVFFCVRYLVKLNDSYRSIVLQNVEQTTRSIATISVGLHYRIQLAVQDIQPRQRVVPRGRALPCPPGQMRHNRSWDRPSNIFNHPSNPR